MGRFGGLIVAMGLAIIAAVVIFRMQAGEVAKPTAGPVDAQIKTVNVFVAAKPIALGTTVSQEMIAIQPWPENLVLSGFVRADQGPGKVVGSVARSAFQQQEPIIDSKLANPSDPNFLAGELPKGMRVITIPTNETEGLAGFVFPGDHVDIMLTHDVDVPKVSALGGSTSEFEKKPVTETVLTNVKVLAVDQRASGAQSTDKEGRLIIPRSVSLMVSPTDAQRIRLSQKVGTLTLALRALADRETADPLMLTNGNDISQYKTEAAEATGDVTVYRGVALSHQNTPGGAVAAKPLGVNQDQGVAP